MYGMSTSSGSFHDLNTPAIMYDCIGRYLFWLQVTLELRDRLRDLGVQVNVKTFEEHHGIVGLGEDPFVSSFNYQEILGLQK